MGQEFTINSRAIEDRINTLLPSQGGFGAGIDFSASTTIIPIIDLTQTAEGSGLRQDLQSSLSLTSVTAFNVENTTTTLVSTTGYFRIFGNVTGTPAVSGSIRLSLTDGITTKIIIQADDPDATPQLLDFIVFITAGDSLTCRSSASNIRFQGCSRQIADITGTLVNPL
jgi:hypothetical protein|tara:strand:+ start:118 stop:624 length:507 start_codon:yes stop_codon:yes gene_type:complete